MRTPTPLQYTAYDLLFKTYKILYDFSRDSFFPYSHALCCFPISILLTD